MEELKKIGYKHVSTRLNAFHQRKEHLLRKGNNTIIFYSEVL